MLSNNTCVRLLYTCGLDLLFILKSVDLTEMAREGKLDPTIGRDEGVYPFLSSKVLS